MSKVTLGASPTKISKVIKAILPDGSPAMIEVDFKFRKRSEFATLVDAREAAKAARRAHLLAQAAPPVPLSAEQEVQLQLDDTAQYLSDIVLAWNLDTELTLPNLRDLCDQAPALAAQLEQDYQIAVVYGRLGNS